MYNTSKVMRRLVCKVCLVSIVSIVCIVVVNSMAALVMVVDENRSLVYGKSFDNTIVPQGDQPVRVFLDGEQIIFDMHPVVIQGRTLVPIRAIFEAFGAEVSWDHETQTAEAVKTGTMIVIRRDATTAWLNGDPVELDVHARTIGSRMMVPLRFVSESLGMDVQWTEKEQQIDLFTSIVNSNMEARLTFGLRPPQPIYFATEKYFLDTVPSIYYNLVLNPDQQKAYPPFDIRVIVKKPNGVLMIDRIDQHNVTLSAGAKEFRAHGQMQIAGTNQNPATGNTELGRWDAGSYQVEIWFDKQQVTAASFEVIPAINDIGNTSGNLLNKGLVVSQGERIYYAGKDGSLYKGTVNHSDAEQITTDRVAYLNMQGQWIYFVNTSRNNVVSKIRYDDRSEPLANHSYYTRQGEAETLSHDEAGQLLLYGDWLYYVNHSDNRHLVRMRQDGSQKQTVIDKPIHQFYIQANQIIYMTYEDTYENHFSADADRNRNQQDVERPSEQEQAVGYLYVAKVDGIYSSNGVVAGTLTIRDTQRVNEQLIMSMAVEGDWVYYLVPIDRVSWASRVSGRVPANLYRADIVHATNAVYSSADTVGATNTVYSSANTVVEKLLGDQEVMNFYIDSEMLLVQGNLNRGKVWHRYSPDGVFISDISTQVIRKTNSNLENLLLHNRTTFPVTYMNRAFNWMYYYVGDEDELITDHIPMRNDKRLTIRNL